MSVIKAQSFSASDISFADSVKVNKYGGKSVYANYNGAPLRIQLPKMAIPFGVSRFSNPDKPEEIKYSLELSLAGLPDSFLRELDLLESAVISHAESKSKELFKKQQSKDLLLEFYKSFIKYAEDENGERSDKYPPRLKTKIYTSEDGAFRVAAFDTDRVKLDVTEDNVDSLIPKGAVCEAIIECTGIWVVNKSFGVSWKLAQLKVHENGNALNGYAFHDDAPSDEPEPDTPEEIEALDEVSGLSIDADSKRTRRKREVII